MKRDLEYWKEWASRNEAALGDQAAKMDDREALYRGEVRKIQPLTPRDTERNGDYRTTAHLRNIVAENIESEVNSVIPQPKVTARRQTDESKAKILEDMLRNELDRLPMEVLNDLAERIVPIQGGVYWLVEWDESQKTHSFNGDVRVSLIHPKQIIPQDGVFTAVEDMDAIVVKLPQTRSYIERVFGKKLDEDEGEENPEARTLDADASSAEDLVTQYVAYFRNDEGGIGKFSWVNDTVLEDLEDYEARRVKRCSRCGEPLAPDTKICPVCGNDKSKTVVSEEEEFPIRKEISPGVVVPGTQVVAGAGGVGELQPSTIPYYKPDVFPLFLQRNVSVFGRLLGDSDVDKIADQQNTVNRLETKIIDRFVKAGTKITLPSQASLRMDPQDNDVWMLENPQDAALIKTHDFSGDLSQEMAYLTGVYEEARQILGITDSFQGRRDETAQSGVAKRFAAQQSAGRLESKRVLKEASYAELFKRITQLKVAYADEPRPIVAEDNRGRAKYEEFNRMDFYEMDPQTGEWHCILDDDRFLFSCDVSAPLAANREQMWQDTTQMLQIGAFGPQDDPQTMVMYWTKMARAHYPGAEDTLDFWEERIAQQQQAAMIAQAQQAAMEEAQARQQSFQQFRQSLIDVDNQARQDAMRTAEAMAKRQMPNQ